MNAVGTRIWQLLPGAGTLGEVHRTLCAEFAADAACIEQDLLALVRELAEAGLVELS